MTASERRLRARVAPAANLPRRSASASGSVAVILSTLFFYRALFLVVVAAAIGVALWELDRAHPAYGRDHAAAVCCSPARPGCSRARSSPVPGSMVAVFAATVLLALVWRMPGGADGFLRDVTATVFCLVYVAVARRVRGAAAAAGRRRARGR